MKEQEYLNVRNLTRAECAAEYAAEAVRQMTATPVPMSFPHISEPQRVRVLEELDRWVSELKKALRIIGPDE